jgi:hypothetical protein
LRVGLFTAGKVDKPKCEQLISAIVWNICGDKTPGEPDALIVLMHFQLYGRVIGSIWQRTHVSVIINPKFGIKLNHPRRVLAVPDGENLAGSHLGGFGEGSMHAVIAHERDWLEGTVIPCRRSAGEECEEEPSRH